ncbi:hypothetical protein [Bradyrhizobium sp. STM 3557]|uniref:hypothetical protein n=1 Tax=Bradyrhizobium sp. STM 3557 TaxID=578920 RepID=UPI00388D1EA5
MTIAVVRNDDVSEPIAGSAPRSLARICALVIGGMLAIVAVRSVSDQLWSDELLTTNLLTANSIRKLWAGIALGIDGNPPFYMTAAWLLTRPLPDFAASVVLLKLLNVVLAAAGIAALCRVARRIASANACWIGAALFIPLSDAFIYAASELRTYALYFLMAALAVLCQQRLIEQRRRIDVAWLALANLGLAMAHTFGIAYVGCIALAGWLSQPRDGRRLFPLIVIAVLPAIVAVAAWSPSLIRQLAVAKPYNWMMQPTLSGLADILFGSDVMLWLSTLEACCLLAAGLAHVKQDGLHLRPMLRDPQWQPVRFAGLVLAATTVFTFAGWLFSQVAFPIYVPRFFTPQLFAAFALHVAFGEWLLRHARERRTLVLAICAVIAPLVARNAVLHANSSVHGKPICADTHGVFFESAFVSGDLPVMVDSPHMFLPRATYAAHGEAYRFPLDWDVVLNYPDRSRGNAVDFHIMQGLQTWEPMPQVESTDDIVRKYPQFLVIEQPYRAWFHNLVETRNVTAEKLAETVPAAPDEIACTLWKVRRVAPRP